MLSICKDKLLRIEVEKERQMQNELANSIAKLV